MRKGDNSHSSREVGMNKEDSTVVTSEGEEELGYKTLGKFWFSGIYIKSLDLCLLLSQRHISCSTHIIVLNYLRGIFLLLQWSPMAIRMRAKGFPWLMWACMFWLFFYCFSGPEKLHVYTKFFYELYVRFLLCYLWRHLSPRGTYILL